MLKESLTLRVCRATQHARATLQAGFTTLRDLGTEGAGYADVGIKKAIDQGIIPGPRLLVVTRAIVATGSYAPRRTDYAYPVPQGAEEASGDSLIRVVRDQIGNGADWIKIYADTPWGPTGKAQPTFSVDEIKLIVETAKSAGCLVAAHAVSKEGIRRAAHGGVATIEHGDEGDIEVLEINETTSMIKFSNHGTLMTLSLERDGAKPPPPTGAPPATVVGAPPSPVGYPVAQPPTNVSPLTRTIRQVPPPPMTPNAVPTQPNPAVPNVAVPQAQATERPLTPEEQIILMEVERERNKARIQNGTLPPLPPTPLTPQ